MRLGEGWWWWWGALARRTAEDDGGEGMVGEGAGQPAEKGFSGGDACVCVCVYGGNVCVLGGPIELKRPIRGQRWKRLETWKMRRKKKSYFSPTSSKTLRQKVFAYRWWR